MALKRRKLNNSGILSNSYIPPLRATQIDRELQKLPPDSLYNLTHLWLSIPSTQPVPNAYLRRKGYTKSSLADTFLTKLKSLKNFKNKTQLKKKLINTILVEFYPNGLNTLQLAQIDVQLLVDRPTSSSWISSTVKIVNGSSDIPSNEEDISNDERNDKISKLTNYTFSLDSQLFLDKFIANLANLYLTHVYISRHPYFPLIMVRVQMYDYTYHRSSATHSEVFQDLTNRALFKSEKMKFNEDLDRILNNKNNRTPNQEINTNLQRQVRLQIQPQVRSHKPFYILLPISSPHVIHSVFPPDDVCSRLILQTLETTLANDDFYKVNRPCEAKTNKLDTNTSIITSRKIRIFRDADIPKPIKNLNTMFLLRGISRFGSSLGAWAPYAEGVVDMDIFENELKHLIVQPEEMIELDGHSDDDLQGRPKAEDRKQRKIISALKFKGTLKRIKPKKLYKCNGNHGDSDDYNDASIDLEEYEQNNENFFESEQKRLQNRYASAVPINESKFEIKAQLEKKKTQGNEKDVFSFTMELTGSDVYGGLHELADQGVIDPCKIPDWLTGEVPMGGTVVNGKLRTKR